MYLYKNQQGGLLKFEVVDNGNDMRIHLDQALLMTEGAALIR